MNNHPEYKHFLYSSSKIQSFILFTKSIWFLSWHHVVTVKKLLYSSVFLQKSELIMWWLDWVWIDFAKLGSCCGNAYGTWRNMGNFSKCTNNVIDLFWAVSYFLVTDLFQICFLWTVNCNESFIVKFDNFKAFYLILSSSCHVYSKKWWFESTFLKKSGVWKNTGF